jgi:hypothetical protein
VNDRDNVVGDSGDTGQLRPEGAKEAKGWVLPPPTTPPPTTPPTPPPAPPTTPAGGLGTNAPLVRELETR